MKTLPAFAHFEPSPDAEAAKRNPEIVGWITIALSDLAPDVQAAVRERADHEGKTPAVVIEEAFRTALHSPEIRDEIAAANKEGGNR